MSLTVSNIPWDKNLSVILELPSDTFPHGRFYLYGSYNAVDFTHILATEDYVQQQIQGAINASY